MASGCEVTDIGVVPTPLLYYSVFHLKADGAVMITGSHNPSEYNGFKIVCGASTIHGEEIQEVRRMIETRRLRERRRERADRGRRPTPYVDEIAAQFQFARRIKVVARRRQWNGRAGDASHVRKARTATPPSCSSTWTADFPNHHPDPTVPENLQALIAEVRETRARPGDRLRRRLGPHRRGGRAGDVICGDQLMIIYAREILSRKPGATFIGEVKCSQSLYDDIRQRGGNAIMWRTGHSLIKAKMKETHAELAGEMSGHMFFADRYYGFDDALYAACRLMEIVAQSGQPLSAQLADLPDGGHAGNSRGLSG